MQKKPFFVSLNVKILLAIMTTFLVASGVSLFVFLSAFITQMEAEALYNKNKASIIWEMYQENRTLRQMLSDLYNKRETVDTLLKKHENRLDALLTKDSFFSLRYNAFSDRQNIKIREQKMHMVSVFVSLSFVLFMLVLIFLWMYLRRRIMEPLEGLLEGTKKLSEGKWGYRLPEKTQTMADEIALLEQNFNVMAASLHEKVDALQQSEHFLQSLLNAVPDGIRVIDENFNIVRVNQSYAARYPAQNGSLLDRKCYQARCRSDTPCLEENCPVTRLKSGERSSVKIIQSFYGENDHLSFAEVAAAPLVFQKDGQTVCYTVETVRSLEQEIMFSHRQKLASLGVLSGSVAHEMRNPLGSIRLILESILDREKPLPDDELKKYLTLIYNQINVCVDVTSRLLKLARKPTETKEKVNLNDVVSETASLMEYEAKKSGLAVQTVLCDKPAFVLATDAEMRMMTLNLMQNAFHAMTSGGKMTLTVSQTGETVRVDFSDTGHGIAADDLPHIFEPFFSKNQTDNQGTGLGLAIVKNIVDNHGGSVHVESAVGKGTTFSMTFPVYEDDGALKNGVDP